MDPTRLSKIMKSDTQVPKDIQPYALNDMGSKTARPARKNALKGSASRRHHGHEGVGDEASEIEREAYERGFIAGEEAGHALGLKKVEHTRKLLSEMIAEMNQLQMEIVKAAEQDILAIALAVAQRILGDETHSDRERLLKNIHEAIKKVGQSDKIIIRLSPQDIDQIVQESDALSRLVKQEGKIKFEADNTLISGECIVDGQERMVDARFKSQVAVFIDAFSKEENEA